MKHVSWLLVAAALAYPVLAQIGGGTGQASTARGPVKILGQPAASEWVDIVSNDLNGSPTQYIVPSGKALTLEHLQRREKPGGGTVAGQVRVDGVAVTVGDDTILLDDGDVADVIAKGEVAREGQIVTVERVPYPAAEAPQDATFILRGWLEDTP